MCRELASCVALLPDVSLTRFGECVATRIHWSQAEGAVFDWTRVETATGVWC
jgi:hypothetical protein